jgi:preprotein translocase subunit Sec61beta
MLWVHRVVPVVVQLKRTTRPLEEFSINPTTAGLSRFWDIGAEIRRDQMDPKRVLVVEVLVALEKTRSIKQEVGQAARESVSTWVAEPSTLLVEVVVPLSTVLRAWEVPPVG